MFGKKKESGTPVMHYEGIEGFATDYPCRIEVKGDVFEIRRIKSFSALEEKNFMQKYHGTARTTGKSGINKYYLVVEYDKGMLAFWGTAKEYKQFIALQYATNTAAPSHIEL